MELPDADHYYTEQLIRLPKLSISYTPVSMQPLQSNRSDYGLRENSILYLCCQSLFKYLPQYDEVFPRIAQGVRDCQFVFISNKSTLVTEQFHKRIEKAFSRFNLDIQDYAIFLPRLDARRYYTLNCLSDIFLDSIGWTGCNSTFEAIACNLPVVTLQGELMRARHSAAILHMMELTETIAKTLNEYIEISKRLGRDSAWRKTISEKVIAKKHLLYDDKECITVLEHFFEKAVKERLENIS
jgi:predicted O-linked N-acetylglucosamine transferase (SPINDLY family)